ncbi:MAG: hypothetical protein K0S80_4401 [Neobacillus sp.]|nr:hypothetical protein [Neobacillus sp.]
MYTFQAFTPHLLKLKYLGNQLYLLFSILNPNI